MYLLVEGAVQLHRSTEDGREIVIKVIMPGESFAEAILFEQDSYPATAIALKPSRLILVPKKRILGLLDDPSFRDSFIGALMGKLRYLADRIPYLTTRDVEDRLVLFLRNTFGQASQLTVSLSKKDVAAAIGTNPETLSRCLARLRDSGLLQWQGQQVTVAEELWSRHE